MTIKELMGLFPFYDPYTGRVVKDGHLDTNAAKKILKEEVLEIRHCMNIIEPSRKK